MPAATGTLAGVAVVPADTEAADGAPIVELHFPPGILTQEQKAAPIEGVTGVVLCTTGLPLDQAGKLWVPVLETAAAGWGVGGKVFQPHRK